LRQERSPYRIPAFAPFSSAGGRAMKIPKSRVRPASAPLSASSTSPSRTQRDHRVIAHHQVRASTATRPRWERRAPRTRGFPRRRIAESALAFGRVTTTFARSADAPGRGRERRDPARADRSRSSRPRRDARARSRRADARRGDSARPPSRPNSRKKPTVSSAPAKKPKNRKNPLLFFRVRSMFFRSSRLARSPSPSPRR
jgi:hypothetical protein